MIKKKRRFSECQWLRAAGFVIALAASSMPRLAAANELDAFQQALRAYDGQEYAVSATLLEALVGGEQPRLQNRALVLESRKYLAASYLFLGRRADAAEQFVRLLREDPVYQLDPLAFPDEVQKAFAEARKTLEQERIEVEKQIKRAQSEATLKKKTASQEDRDNLNRLFAIAQTQQVERMHSRWVAMIPFGAGQFQNGDRAWGTFFAVSEGITAAVDIVSYFFHASLKGQNPAVEDLGEARFAESAFRFTNQVSFTLLVTLVIAGIIEAQVDYKPLEITSRPRPLPEELRNVLKFSIETGSMNARFRF